MYSKLWDSSFTSVVVTGMSVKGLLRDVSVPSLPTVSRPVEVSRVWGEVPTQTFSTGRRERWGSCTWGVDGVGIFQVLPVVRRVDIPLASSTICRVLLTS